MKYVSGQFFRNQRWCPPLLWISVAVLACHWISNRAVDSVATAETRMPEYPTNTLLPRRIRGKEVRAPTAHERSGEWNQALLMWPVRPLISSITAQLHTSLSQHRIWVTLEWSFGYPLYLISSSRWFSSPPFPTSSSDLWPQGAGLENRSHVVGALHLPHPPRGEYKPWTAWGLRWVRSWLDNQPPILILVTPASLPAPGQEHSCCCGSLLPLSRKPLLSQVRRSGYVSLCGRESVNGEIMGRKDWRLLNSWLNLWFLLLTF